MRPTLRKFALRYLPKAFYRRLVRATRNPPIGHVDFGGLRRVKPVSSIWGLDRGLPIDRYYIERFLNDQASDIRGHTLEIGDDVYTLRFGGDRINQSDVLHVSEEAPKATIIADLTNANQVRSDTFDCVICTQTLHFIYDKNTAIRTLFRILKPRGVLLVTTPGISQISRYDMDRWGDYWRFTTASVRRLFSGPFPEQNIEVNAYGNVLSAVAFLHGLGTEELTQDELEYLDPDYEVIISVRAQKPEASR